MARLLRFAVCVATAAILAGCSGGGAQISPATPHPPISPSNGSTLQVGPYVATFKEFPLPAGQTVPSDITVGPDGAVWFSVHNGIDRIVGGGTITNFPPPPGVANPLTPLLSQPGGIASANGALWYGVNGFFPNDPQPEQWFVRQPISGAPVRSAELPPDATSTIYERLRTARMSGALLL